MSDLLQKVKREHTSIYVSSDLLADLAKKAKALGVSRNLLIEATLTEGLKAIEKTHKPRKAKG